MTTLATPNVTNQTTQSLTAILHWEEEVYVAECPEVGTASQGDTIEEALANLKEATELYLEEFPLPQISRRLITSFEVGHAQTPAN
jgi:predicted RNase H-like HicB family nuclease